MKETKKFSDAEITVTLPQPLFKLLASQLTYFREWVDPNLTEKRNVTSVDGLLKQFAALSATDKLFQLKHDYCEDLKKFEDDVNTLMDSVTGAYWGKQSEYINHFTTQVNELVDELEDPDRFDLLDGEIIELYFNDSVQACGSRS